MENTDMERILSRLDEITALLERSCRQQQEILKRLDGMAVPGAAGAEMPEQEPEIAETLEFEEFDQRPEDMLTCPRCHIMQSASHDACSHCGVAFVFRSERKETE